jgi:hypothetical protein
VFRIDVQNNTKGVYYTKKKYGLGNSCFTKFVLYSYVSYNCEPFLHLLQLLHHNVDAVERRPNGLQGGSLIIKCKDFRIIQLDISSPDEFVKVATTIENLSSLGECVP